MKSNDELIAEGLADPNVPRRGISTGTSSKLTDEQRSRLVVIDPYGQARQQAAMKRNSEDSVEVELVDGAGVHTSRMRVPSATHEERTKIVELVEDGRAVLCVARPSWWAPSGRFKTHVWG